MGLLSEVKEMKRQVPITVWDYHDAMHGAAPWHYDPDRQPVKYEVDAWCVQGETGIFAYFYVKDKFCMAKGDDGHWTLMYVCHPHWVREFKDTMYSVQEIQT
jgi:hypothetical protein